MREVKSRDQVLATRVYKPHLGTHWQLIGNDFWYDISGWNGTAQGVLKIIGQHAENGLADAREQARKKLIPYLKDKGAVANTGELKWDSLLDLVMTKN